MNDLEKYNLINSCETSEELKQAILTLCNKSGLIQGRTKIFNGIKMANRVIAVINELLPANVLTREFGIRQQVLYLAYYK